MLDGLKNTMSSLQEFDFGQELEKIVTENTTEIEELQQKQLFSGIDRNNNEITLEGLGYARKTIEIKQAKGQPTDRITWKDTGEMYGSLRVSVEGTEFIVDSDNFKFDKMIERSGPETVGLDEESRIEFAENITLPQIKEALREKTGFEIT
jgi:hypothetical protein